MEQKVVQINADIFLKPKSTKIENPAALSKKQSGLVLRSSCLIQMVWTMKISPSSLELSKLKTSEMDLMDLQVISTYPKSKANALLTSVGSLSPYMALVPSFPVNLDLSCSKENNEEWYSWLSWSLRGTKRPYTLTWIYLNILTFRKGGAQTIELCWIQTPESLTLSALICQAKLKFNWWIQTKIQ